MILDHKWNIFSTILMEYYWILLNYEYYIIDGILVFIFAIYLIYFMFHLQCDPISIIVTSSSSSASSFQNPCSHHLYLNCAVPPSLYLLGQQILFDESTNQNNNLTMRRTSRFRSGQWEFSCGRLRFLRVKPFVRESNLLQIWLVIMNSEHM